MQSSLIRSLVQQLIVLTAASLALFAAALCVVVVQYDPAPRWQADGTAAQADGDSPTSPLVAVVSYVAAFHPAPAVPEYVHPLVPSAAPAPAPPLSEPKRPAEVAASAWPAGMPAMNPPLAPAAAPPSPGAVTAAPASFPPAVPQSPLLFLAPPGALPNFAPPAGSLLPRMAAVPTPAVAVAPQPAAAASAGRASAAAATPSANSPATGVAQAQPGGLATSPVAAVAQPTPRPGQSSGPDLSGRAAVAPVPGGGVASSPVARAQATAPASGPGASIPFSRATRNSSKLGIGVYARGGAQMLAEIDKVRPGVVLLMDPDVEFAREVRKLLPNAFIVGRRYVREQPLDDPRRRGAAFADYVSEKAMPTKGVVDAWMSYNEPVNAGDYASYRAYDQFQVAFAERLQGHYGVAAVAGNDGPGAIEAHEYPQYFRQAIQASRYFGAHAYTSQKATTFREPSVDWYALRYRKIYAALEAAGIRNVSLVITEVGLVEGWQGRKIPPEQMAADYIWLANEMHKDSYAIGFAAFGLFQETSRWAAHQLAATRVPELLAFYQPPVQR